VVPQTASLLLVACYPERIADHVVNVAEQAGYTTPGELTGLTLFLDSQEDTVRLSRNCY